MGSTAVEKATGRRREVFAAVSRAADRQGALDALAHLLETDQAGAEEVLGSPLEVFVGAAGQPGDSGTAGFALHPFRDTEEHSRLYADRAADPSSDPAGQWSDERIESERTEGLKRIADEHAAWFVAVDTGRGAPVGLVFGEQAEGGGDVDVAIWVAPEERKKGYGMSSLRESRSAFAAYFPGAHLVVRAPLAGGR